MWIFFFWKELGKGEWEGESTEVDSKRFLLGKKYVKNVIRSKCGHVWKMGEPALGFKAFFFQFIPLLLGE